MKFVQIGANDTRMPTQQLRKVISASLGPDASAPSVVGTCLYGFHTVPNPAVFETSKFGGEKRQLPSSSHLP